MKISKQTIRRWRNRFIFVLVVAIGIVAYIWYINSAVPYDFSHLSNRIDMGTPSAFAPLPSPGGERVEYMIRAAQTEYLALYVNPENSTFAVYDFRNSHVWHSAPQGPEHVANAFHQGVMHSNMGFSHYDALRRRNHSFLYTSAGAHGAFTIYSLPNGMRIEYLSGDHDIGIHALPMYIEETFWRENLHDRIFEVYYHDINAGRSAARSFGQLWVVSDTRPGYMRMGSALFEEDAGALPERMLRMFREYFDWTFYDTMYHNERVGHVPDVSFDFITVVFEIVLDRDRMIVNVPIDQIAATGDEIVSVFALDILRFFGAGCLYTDGFMLVPSGSGGIINFNNGRYREPSFSGRVYGDDPLLTTFIPQVEQSVRLPVLGIRNTDAAIVKHVVSGSAFATANAEVAAERPGVGGTTAQNNAWFSFELRQSMPLDMGGIGGVGGDMRVLQEEIYMGDITIMYHFLAGDNPGVGDMAAAYQGFLVETGALTPLVGTANRTFYMDIIGGIDVQRHILGAPYMAIEMMTTSDDVHRFLDVLDGHGVDNVQVQLHGWFNRGINHDVANRVNLLTGFGNQNDLQELDARLQQGGGGLNPVVNFNLTNWFSRRFSRTFEVARDPAGYIGFMSRVNRDMLFTRFSIHRNDWFILVHPAMMPYHIDDFIPRYANNVGIDGLALADMGDILTESIHRRNPIVREYSMRIAEEQMGRLQEEFPNIVVFGGNDYAIQFASHLVDVPVETDWWQIIDYGVPFYSMVVHGFVEHAGRPANMLENYSHIGVILNSMTTGASPRYVISAQPTRHVQFSPHERFYSTQYTNWLGHAIQHYQIWNDVFRYLRSERIVDFEILSSARDYLMGHRQITVTTFSDGTRVYVNNTSEWYINGDTQIPPMWFTVEGGVCCG